MLLMPWTRRRLRRAAARAAWRATAEQIRARRHLATLAAHARLGHRRG